MAGTKAQFTGNRSVAWLREQIAKTYGTEFNPVMEMLRLYHKERLTRRDTERFRQLETIARYVQPQLKNVEVGVDADASEGKMIIQWRSNLDEPVAASVGDE